MEPSSLIKVTGAFAAGVVLALGGALVYVKTTAAPAHSAPPLVIQPTRNPPPATHVLAPPIQQVETKPPVVVHHVQRVRPKPAVAHDPPTVVQLAQVAQPVIPPPVP